MALVDLPLPVVVTRHQCPYCRRTWARRSSAAAHIARCWRNPATRTCKTCRHYEPPEPGPYPEDPGWPEGCGRDQSLADGIRVGCPLWAHSHEETER